MQSTTFLNDLFSNKSCNSVDLITKDIFALTVGVCYTSVGVIFIFLQLACAYLIHIDKDMQNPTYKLVVNLSVADAIELIALGLYSGITIIIGVQNSTLDRWMSFICLSAWYSNCVLFPCIAFSRWVIICRSHLVKHLLGKNVMLILYAISWAPMSALCFYGCVLHDPPEFGFRRDFFAWGFDVQTRFGEVWHWANFGFNSVMAVIETAFNIAALTYVYKTRKRVERCFTISGNRRQETKLLLQCFVLGCFFTIASVVFTLAYASGWSSRTAFLIMQTTWTFNHCVNPLVYLSVNTKLRKRFVRFVLFRRLKTQCDNGSLNGIYCKH